MSTGRTLEVYTNKAQEIVVTVKKNGSPLNIVSDRTVKGVVVDLDGNVMFTQKTIDILTSPHADTDLPNGVVVFEMSSDDAGELAEGASYRVLIEVTEDDVYATGEKTLVCEGAWQIT